jgi:hypothetical protein
MYLEMVFAVVRRWQRLECSKKNSRAILRLRNGARRMRIEPFSILIFCTADPKVADAKTRSKRAGCGNLHRPISGVSA